MRLGGGARLARPGRRTADDERILPLINVVFLLLIFFMLAGRLTASDPFPVQTPTSASKTLPGSPVLVMHLGVGDQIALDGVAIARDALATALSRRLAEVPNTAVRIKADAAMPAATLVAILQDLKMAGVDSVQLLTQAAN